MTSDQPAEPITEEPPGELEPGVPDAPSMTGAGLSDVENPTTHTRLSGYWVAVAVGLVVLLVLIIFILENSTKVGVSFLGAHAHLDEGVALLLAAVIGGLVVVLAGTARILQLRSRARRTARSHRKLRRARAS